MKRILPLFSTVVFSVVLFLAPCAAPFLHDSPPAKRERTVPSDDLSVLFRSNDPWNRVARLATLSVMEKKYYEDGADVNIGCLDFGDASVILHPDTPPERVRELERTLREFYSSQAAPKVGFFDSARWTATATESSTGANGDPITILWGFLPDGVTIPAAYGSPAQPSVLQAVFDTSFASPGQWKKKIRNAFLQWDLLLGNTYVEVSYDDGASFPGAAGQIGVRPDVRIGGKPIDGGLGILAYNWYPNTGDMVLDTDDATSYLDPTGNFRFIKNVVMHEHGHGLGFGHVQPTDQTKLMEPFASIAFAFAQDDDIRGTQFFYGDPYENNDAAGSAVSLGTLVDSLIVENLSIDRGTDEDYFAVTINDPTVDVTVKPVGSTYLIGNDGGAAPALISTDSINDLDFELYDSTGAALLVSAISAGAGAPETLVAWAAPYAGVYTIHVFRKAGSGNGTQRYELDLRPGVPTSVSAADLPAPVRPGLTVRPNPFNPRAEILFRMPVEGRYSLEIFDVAGRLVHIDEGRAADGAVSLIWNGEETGGGSAASGVYMMRVTVPGGEEIRRAVLIR